MLSLQPSSRKLNQSQKQIFNFIDIPACKTSESTPVLANQMEGLKSNYFTKTIDPKCSLVKEMYEASKLARELGIISPQLIQQRGIEVSTQKFKKVIVLDLDETLVHTKKHVSTIRPHCEEFLWRLSQIAVVVLFTASKKEHAQKMVKLIDPQKKIFQKICTSDHCIGFIKNLNIFNVDLKDILLVDNSPKNCIAQLDNGVPIIPFLGDEEDHELLELLEFLQECIKCEDVRIPIADKFKIAQFHKEISGRHAVYNLYNNSIK